MANGNGRRITLGILNQQLLDLTAMVREQKDRMEHLQWTLNGIDDKPGVKGRLDRLEQVEIRRGTHIKALWSAMAAVLVGWLLDLFRSGIRP